VICSINCANQGEKHMHMQNGLCILAICSAVTIGSAKANVTQDNFLMGTTGDLVNLCSSAETDPLYTAAVNFCQGFAVGVFRLLQEEDRASVRHLFCAPQQAPTRTETIATFTRWANANSSRLAQPPADGLAEFLSQQFPCPGRR
jgi:hypothetical protein